MYDTVPKHMTSPTVTIATNTLLVSAGETSKVSDYRASWPAFTTAVHPFIRDTDYLAEHSSYIVRINSSRILEVHYNPANSFETVTGDIVALVVWSRASSLCTYYL